MSNRRVQWLKKFFLSPFDNQQSNDRNVTAQSKVTQPPPELTNADLESLFNELLEGVYQARGQQWALNYLQRMKDRIPQQRWLEWLEAFGEKMLTSAAPNYVLAERMMQLGELDIGEIGELAYEYGMELLSRNFSQQFSSSGEQFVETSTDEGFSTNGDIGNLQEVVFVDEAQNSQAMTPQSTQNWEQGLVLEYNAPKSNNYLPEESEFTVIDGEDKILEYFTQTSEAAAASDSFPPLPQTGFTGTIGTGFVLDFLTPLPPFITQTSTSLPPLPQTEFTGINEGVIESTVEAAESITKAAQKVKAAASQAANWDASLVSLPPNLANSLDELLVRLHQSVNLVQQIAVDLGVQGINVQENTQINTRVNAQVNTQNNTQDIQEAATVTNVVLDPARAWFYQGLEQVKKGDLQAAVTCYDKAVEIAPDNYEYWYSRGLTQCYLGEFREALSSYDTAVEIKPDFHQGWYYRGGTLGELGRYQEAILSFDQALEIKPDFHEVWSSRGGALLELGRHAEAISSYDKALAFQPFDSDSWYQRGVALSENGQQNQAITSFERAIENQPDFYLAWYNRGLALSGLGRDGEAVNSFEKAIEIKPDFHAPWYFRGSILYKSGQIDDALLSYEQATQLKPDFHEGWIDRGVALSNLGQLENAIAAYDKALEIRPDLHLAWYNRGVALENLGRREEAIAAYDKALEVRSDLYLARYNRGVALFYLGRYEEAIASYDRALLIKPDYWEAWLGRGSAVGIAVNYNTSDSFATNISSNNPALDLRGIEGKLASYEEGLRYVSQDTHSEGWGRLHLAMGSTYYEIGKRELAPSESWNTAQAHLEAALLTLTRDDYVQLHLEVLQNLITVLLGLGRVASAQDLQRRATDIWRQLLNEASTPEESKQKFALKFVGIGQLAVDIAINTGELLLGLEIAEHLKNATFAWQILGWTEEIYSPSYAEIQQLLNPTTAIVYWHISPYGLRCFVIKHKATEPIPIFTPVLNVGENDDLPRPEPVKRLVELEDWLKDWNHQYLEYRTEGEEKQNKSNHSYRKEMEMRLFNLRNILNIESILGELEGINQLILIPHRDLQRFPLHALFNLATSQAHNLKITYLPSASRGLLLQSELQSESQNEGRKLSFLSVEHPHSVTHPSMQFGKLESEMISHMFDNPERIQGLKASKKNVEDALTGNYNIFHFVGRSTDNLSYPEQSELALAGSDKLTLQEIAQKQLTAYNLVILSACEVEITANQAISNDYVSLVNGFLNQGVNHVVSTLWTVESAANALVMIEFYRRFLQGKSPAFALSEATVWLKQLTAGELTKWYEDLLNQLPPEGLRIKAHLAADLLRSRKIPPETMVYNHPYYWAGFIVTGR